MPVRNLFLLMLLIGGCSTGTPGGPPPPPAPPPPPPPPPPPTLVISVVEGQNQAGVVGQPVAIRPAVRIADQNNQSAGGVAVTFTAGAGGSVTGANVTTDAAGVARVGGWTLGPMAGPQVLSASAAAQGSPASITATANPGPAAIAVKAAGDGQAGTAGLPVPVVPALGVTDEFGNPVSGMDVVFAIGMGTGTIVNGNRTTGADGVARPDAWILGQIAGPNTLTATVGVPGITGNPATFSATGQPGAPADMLKVAGEGQSAGAGQPVPVPPEVEVTDQFGNLVGGVAVLFAVTGGGGAVTGSNPMTSPEGRATVGSWTLGPTPGPNTLSATAGTATVTFTATGVTPINAAQFAGTYSGTWTNVTFGSMGTATAVVTVDETARTVSATITVTGSVLGSGGVAPVNQQTGFSDAGASFQGVLPVMGNVSASVDADGKVTASGTNVPNPGITRWDATGTLTATTLSLDFTVTFSAGAPATGTILLTKP